MQEERNDVEEVIVQGAGGASDEVEPRNSAGIATGGRDAHYANTNLDLAIRSLNHLYRSIERDLTTAENEISFGGAPHTESFLNEMKDFCNEIDKQINSNLKEAGEKVARLDQKGVTGAAATLSGRLASYSDRIRAVQTDLRRARGSVTPSGGSVSGSGVQTLGGSVTQGYKPFIEKLKPPVFSGKVEEWPEFRRVWQDLLSGLPDSVQLQHVKTNIPTVDSKRITRLKTKKEVWKSLERVYGDKYMNMIAVKSNLESLVPKATQDQKRIQEVYEAVETAIAQLRNLSALHYLQEVFSLMNKIVMKLPIAEQTKYTDYITSESVKTSLA